MFVAASFVMLSLKYGLQKYPGDQARLAGRYTPVFVGVACCPLLGFSLWVALSKAK